MDRKFSTDLGLVVLLASLLGAGAACSRSNPQDTQLTNTVQGKIASDPQLQGQDIHASASNGVVTLTGTASTPDQRTQAEADANVAGVTRVVDQIATSSVPANGTTAANQPAPAAAPARRYSRGAERAHGFPAPSGQAAPSRSMNNVATYRPMTPSLITIPASTVLAVRVSQPLSSNLSSAGQGFTGRLARPVAMNNQIAIPAGATVQGTVVTALSSGHIKGRSELALRLNSISYNGQTYPVRTATWSRLGPSRGKRSAEVIGGGAGLGALIGAIAGKGKGAAIGSAVGAGAGTATQVLTKPAQIKLPAEAVVDFTLSSNVQVRPAGAVLR